VPDTTIYKHRLLFLWQNGGWPKYFGNNYPLRGGKFTVYEGGTRAISFVHGAGLQKTGESFERLVMSFQWKGKSNVLASIGEKDSGLIK
jgi:hypothetical protein